MSESLRERIFEQLDALTLIDPHTHIDPHAPAATTLADILGYHYYTELAHSAGMPKAQIEEPGLDPKEKVARLVEAVTRWNVWAMTNLPDDIIEGVFFRPVHDLQAAVDEALAADPEARAVVLPSASITVPHASD